jgi:hypothetical protein
LAQKRAELAELERRNEEAEQPASPAPAALAAGGAPPEFIPDPSGLRARAERQHQEALAVGLSNSTEDITGELLLVEQRMRRGNPWGELQGFPRNRR